MSALQNKPIALWFELKGGINLGPLLCMLKAVSAEQQSFLSGSINNGSFD